ncbi:MAG: hypothetical protein IIW17_09230 [Clostridia bacterium]|nr:hypothetical protein [Clostridia bacterium]
MKDYTAELIEKAKAAKSAEELLALAKENNVELTEQEAKTYFEQLNQNDTVSDDDLEMISGGGCPEDDDSTEKEDKPNTEPCPYCSRPVTVSHSICPWCGKVLVFS